MALALSALAGRTEAATQPLRPNHHCAKAVEVPCRSVEPVAGIALPADHDCRSAQSQWHWHREAGAVGSIKK